MPKKSDLDRFRETAIGSAGKLQSILHLVNRAIILLKETQTGKEKRAENLLKVRNILAQLERALNFREGGQAGGLFFIYDYLYDELTRGDDRAIATAIRMLSDLRDVYEAVRKKGAVE